MSMDSVAAPIWNEIARIQKLRTKWARDRFSLDEDQLTKQMERDYDQLMAKGLPYPVVAGFQDTFHLLVEQPALSAYKETHPDLRHALPELNSINEAVILASQDHLMTTSQQKQLQDLLSEYLIMDRDINWQALRLHNKKAKEELSRQPKMSMEEFLAQSTTTAKPIRKSLPKVLSVSNVPANKLFKKYFIQIMSDLPTDQKKLFLSQEREKFLQRISSKYQNKYKISPFDDDDVYHLIRPSLMGAWHEAKAPSKNIRATVSEFIRIVICEFGVEVKPYAKMFYKEVLDGSTCDL